MASSADSGWDSASIKACPVQFVGACPFEDDQNPVQQRDDRVAVLIGQLRILQQLGAVGLQTADLSSGVLDLPTIIVHNPFHTSAGLPVSADEVLAVQFPTDEDTSIGFGPPLFEPVLRRNPPDRQANLPDARQSVPKSQEKYRS